MTYAMRVLLLITLLTVGACAIVPTGPGVMALPGTGKNFDQFRADDFECRQYASAQTGGATPSQAAADSGVTSAAVGALIGAVAGAAIDGGRGAGVGAGTGLAIGALAGTGAAESSSYGLQRRYDYAYIQCMYAKGHKVPVSGRLTSSSQNAPTTYVAPPAQGAAPYPPPGYPPPPPPGSPPPPPPR